MHYLNESNTFSTVCFFATSTALWSAVASFRVMATKMSWRQDILPASEILFTLKIVNHIKCPSRDSEIHTEDTSSLFHNFFQLLLAPASHGPFQSSLWSFGHSPSHLLYHKLPGEPRRSKDNQVVWTARSGFKTRHVYDERVLNVAAPLSSPLDRLTVETSCARGVFDCCALRYFRSNIC